MKLVFFFLSEGFEISTDGLHCQKVAHFYFAYSLKGQILTFLSKASIAATSAGLSSKSKMSKFSASRFLFEDFGIGTVPC
jgi:hypothetical protein